MAKFTGVRPKSGGIELRWDFQGQQHSKFINQPPTKTNLESASRQRKKLIELCRLGGYCETPELSQTVLDVAQDMLKHKSKELKQSTLDNYLSILNRYWSALFVLMIDQVTLKDLRNLDRKTKWKKAKTRNNAISALKQVFSYAMDEDIIDVDPSVKLKPIKTQKPPIDSFTIEEREAIIEALHDNYKIFYLFMFDVGMRTGEVQGLKWMDIKGEYGVVERSIYRGTVTTTKTHQARRVLLSPRLIKALKSIQGNRFKSEWIFTPKGSDKPYATDRSITQVFKRACEMSEVRYRRPYFARHTYATQALLAGVNPVTVAKQIGDRLETMQKNYADVMAQHNDREELKKAH